MFQKALLQKTIAACVTLGALALSNPANATVLFSENFETNTSSLTGAGFLSSTGGYAAQGFGNYMLRNWDFGSLSNASTLSFTLTSPEEIMITFDIAFIDSWDGVDGGCCNPDVLNMALNDDVLLTQSVNNVWEKVPGFFYASASESISAASTEMINASAGLNLAGEWNGDSGYDSLYSFNLYFGLLNPGTYTISWFADGAGWQAGMDESFAIDNIVVSSLPVPEADTYAMMGLGLGLLAFARRKAA